MSSDPLTLVATGGRLARLRSRLADRAGREQLVALGMRLLGAALGYAMLTLAARTLSLADFADFALLVAASGLFSAVATLGQDTLLLRDLPVALDARTGAHRRLMVHAGRVASLGALLAALGACAYAAHALNSGSLWLIAMAGLLVAANGAAEMMFAVQRGAGAVQRAVFNREVLWKLFPVLGLALLWAGAGRATALGASGLYLAGLLLSVVLGAAFAKGLWRRPGETDTTADADGRPSSGGGAFFLINLVAQAGVQVDVLILGALAAVDPVMLGAFYAAQRTTQLFWMIPYGASITAASQIPLAWAQGQREAIARLSRQLSRTLFPLLLTLAAAAWIWRREIMGLYRPEFAEHAGLLAILALPAVISAAGGLHNVIPPLCGQERIYSALRAAIAVSFWGVKYLVALSGDLYAFAWTGVAEAVVVTAMGVILSARRLRTAPV
ncbi:hypothetical protein LJR219_002680 [Phenylobacterium sp. LjRoot219]|uniref:lipopolysaccharide biosynthesis protein n=1 Tax=Phenylobacterium sp. LjRoot219 TaxID=3342283 RepID=UPI003ECDB3C6